MAHRAQLLPPDGLLAQFADAELRVILRPTSVYGVLLAESFHPDLLRDALDRDRLFDRLWLAVDDRPGLAPAITAERRALYNGDIPFFTTRASATDLWASATDRIDQFFAASGLAAAGAAAQQFSEQDLERQVWIIRASLATLAERPHQPHRSARVRLERRTPGRPSELLAEACRIGDRLERLALRGPQEVNWLGLAMTSARHGEVTPLGLDLYDGMPGVVLFLAYLGALSGVERYTALAHAACATMRRTVQDNRAELTWVGGFIGWGGVLYTLTHLAALWRQPQILDEAQEIVELLPALIDQDAQLDVLSGAAGCLVALLNLHEARPCQHTLAAAIQCGDRLLARAQPVGDGLCWPVPGLGPVAGFSHGAAGIAWALLALFARTREERFRTAARGGIAYERSVFSPRRATGAICVTPSTCVSRRPGATARLASDSPVSAGCRCWRTTASAPTSRQPCRPPWPPALVSITHCVTGTSAISNCSYAAVSRPGVTRHTAWPEPSWTAPASTAGAAVRRWRSSRQD